MKIVDADYGLGLEPGINRLVDYNPLWPQAYEEEAIRLKAALRDLARGIEHIGSTAVPGLCAKPIIDMQVGVAEIDHGLCFIEPLAKLGYDYAGSQGISDHHIFGRGVARTHLVHVVVFEGEQWFLTLRFRDRLVAEPAERAAYETLKLSLAAQTIARSKYTAGKTAFVERVSTQPPMSRLEGE
jgi:GrpB-like predicted nucleotidyltransferase (UPF0157 family)